MLELDQALEQLLAKAAPVVQTETVATIDALGRVLAQPVVGKAEISAKLCTTEGLLIARIPHRIKADYARAKRWRWGDAVMDES